jgi:putative membrane protein
VARRRRLQRLAVSRTLLQRRADLASFSVTVARGTRLAIRHVERPLAADLLARLAPAAVSPTAGDRGGPPRR